MNTKERKRKINPIGTISCMQYLEKNMKVDLIGVIEDIHYILMYLLTRHHFTMPKVGGHTCTSPRCFYRDIVVYSEAISNSRGNFLLCLAFTELYSSAYQVHILDKPFLDGEVIL